MKRTIASVLVAVLLSLACFANPVNAAFDFRDIICIGESLTCGSGANEEGVIGSIDKNLTFPARLDYYLPDGGKDGENVIYYNAYNYGISGVAVLPEYKWAWSAGGYLQTARNSSTANPFASSAPEADYVVVMLGTNDAKDRVWKTDKGTGGAENFYRYYTEMIEALKGLPAGPEVLCVVPPPVVDEEGLNYYEIVEETLRDEITPIIKRVSAEQQCLLVDLREVFPDPVTERDELLALYAKDDGVHPNKDGYDLIGATLAEYILRVPGDANGSGSANSDDIASFAKYLAGWDDVTVKKANMDVNRDSQLSGSDLALLAKHFAYESDSSAEWDVPLL